MGAAVALRNVVGERQDVLVIAVVPPHSDFDANVVFLAAHIDRLWHHRGFRAVEIFNELFNATVIEQLGFQRLCGAFILKDDPHTGIQERQFAQALFEGLEGVFKVAEGVGRGKETHLGTGVITRFAHDLEVLGGFTTLKPRDVLFAVTPDPQFEPVRQRVHNRNPNAVQTAGDLVGVAVKLTARVQLGHNDLGRRHTLFRVNIHGNPAPVVADGNRVIRVNFDGHIVRVACQSFVDAIVHDFIDHVVQAGAVVSVTDIHAGAFANRLQAFENFDRIRAILLGVLGAVAHVMRSLILCPFYSLFAQECHANRVIFWGV